MLSLWVAPVQSPPFFSSFQFSCFSFPGGPAKQACKVPCPLPHVCGGHVLRQSHVPLWLPLLVSGQKQIDFRWEFTYLHSAQTCCLPGNGRYGNLKHENIFDFDDSCFFLFLEAFSAPVFVSGPDKNGFNVGTRKNLEQVFGENRRLWFIPVVTRRVVFTKQQVNTVNVQLVDSPPLS